MKLENVVPWGRSKTDYVRIFALTGADLARRILDCAGGPASFNAEVTRNGHSVVSCDPIYHFSAEDISARIEDTYEGMMRNVRENPDAFVWMHVGSPERHGRSRMFAMRHFLDDFPEGLREGRYVAGELPALPFADASFDLTLCSHFLFTYSSQFSREFHLTSVLEMCRVAREARVFPLLTRSVHRNMVVGERSQHLQFVTGELDQRGYEVQVEQVPYEFQRGGDEMLRVSSQSGPSAE